MNSLLRPVSAALVCAILGLPTQSMSDMPAPPEDFPASALRDGLKGAEFSYRGLQQTGPAGLGFARGYVSAIADQAAASGLWCGTGKILPHEVTAQVFDHLNGLDADASGQAATAAVIEALTKIYPCKHD